MISLTAIDATNDLIYYPEDLDTGKTLWFVRNVMDVDALRGSGINAVCAQEKHGAIERSAKFFQQFPAVFVALADTDSRVTAAAVANELADFCPRLAVLTPKAGAFGKFKTVADALRGGRLRADHLILGAVERPVKGLLDLADVGYVDLSKIPCVLSGIPALDKTTGGFRPSEFTVVTGKRGTGKSTLMGQFLLDAVDQGCPVCAYSGELSAEQFKSWIVQQAAGPQYTKSIQDSMTGKWFVTVEESVQQKINDWLRGKFFLYDSGVMDSDSIKDILEVFTYAVRRHGCCVFLADNMMTMQTETPSQALYEKQGEIAGRLKKFSRTMEAHVFLVAHPRKGAVKESDDVSGNSEITDRADNVFIIDKLTEEEKEEENFDTVLRITKNRFDGVLDNVKLCFDKSSRRLQSPDTTPGEKVYGWQR